MRTGIIVARFQCSYLHEGHIALIHYVQSRNEKVVVFLGSTQTRLTKNNPLDYNVRKAMVLESFPNIKVHEFPDQKYDTAWNDLLDNTISTLYPDDDIVLYGSRDSFVDRYKGRFRTELMSPIKNVSSTRLRSPQHDYIQSDPMFRQGIIYASGQKYPTSYQAIDVAIVDFNKNRLLLGKKKDENKYRFIGGFVDVEDEKLELAGKREVREEAGDIETDQYEYVGSFRINDWRYRGEQDKIMTAFFCCHYIYGHVEGKDDICEVKWFDLKDISEKDIEPEHHNLLTSLQIFLTKNSKIEGTHKTPDTNLLHDEHHDQISLLLNTPIMKCGIEEFPYRKDIHSRAIGMAQRIGITFLYELVSINKNDLYSIRNTGLQTITCWETFLKTKKLYFGFDVEKYGFKKFSLKR